MHLVSLADGSEPTKDNQKHRGCTLAGLHAMTPKKDRANPRLGTLCSNIIHDLARPFQAVSKGFSV